MIVPEDIFVSLGNKLKNVRKTRGLTQEELSALSGVSTRHISKIEKGVMNPSYEILTQIAAALGMTPDYFFASDNDEDENNIQLLISLYKQRFTRGYKRYKETSGLMEWKIGHIFHSIFT